MREQQPSTSPERSPMGPSSKWLNQALTALALTLTLATYLHATGATVAATPVQSETVGWVSAADRAL